MISSFKDSQKLEIFYGRKLSVIKKAVILSRIAIVAKIRISRNEKRNHKLLSLWIEKYWNYIEPYLNEFQFHFNNGYIPEGMFCIFKGNSGENSIGIYETQSFHDQYLKASQKPVSHRQAIFVPPKFNPLSINDLLNHPIST